jgi:hypothetical protein
MTRKAVLLRVGHRRARQLKWTGQLLIVLALSMSGCARGDWTTETLTLVDLTGTWEGVFQFPGRTGGLERTTRWVLQQKGGKVRGEVQALDGAPRGSIERLVNGEVQLAVDGPVHTVAGRERADPIVSRRGDDHSRRDERSSGWPSVSMHLSSA